MPRAQSPKRAPRAQSPKRVVQKKNKAQSSSLLDLQVGFRWNWILIFFLGLWLNFVRFHYNAYQVFNPIQIAVSFFVALNFMICLWEICLGLRIDEIHSRHLETRTPWFGRELEFAWTTCLGQPTRVRDLLSASYWGQIWSTYAIFDPAYSSRKSFGFFIDVGNGWITLLPSLLCLYGMTFDVSQWLSPTYFALINICIFYQAWYGTVIYFLSFFFNRRYKFLSLTNTILFVGCTNGIWLSLPLLGIYSCFQVLQQQNYDIFRT